MTGTSLIGPVLAQVALTFVLMFWMGRARYLGYREGQVQIGDPGTRPVWLGYAGQVSNAYHNQLEMPILFYAAAAFAMITGVTAWPMTALAWGYVGCRAIQAAIHTTYNTIAHRFLAFLLGNVVLAAMWVILALRTVWSV